MQTAGQPAIPPVEDLELRVEKSLTRKRVLKNKKLDHKPRKIEHFCDMCGRLSMGYQFQKTVEDVQLYKGCHQQFDLIPEGKTRDAAKRFLLGNVY